MLLSFLFLKKVYDERFVAFSVDFSLGEVLQATHAET